MERRGSGVRVLFSLLNLVLWCKNSQQEVNGTEEKLQEFPPVQPSTNETDSFWSPGVIQVCVHL